MFLLGVTSVLLDGLTHYHLTDAIKLVAIAVYATVGVVITRRQPRNVVGWLLLSAIFLLILSSEASSYLVLRYRLGHSHLPLGEVVFFVQPLWVAAVCLFPPVFLFFPDGRFPSPAWRRVFWAYLAISLCLAILNFVPAVRAAAAHHIRVDSSGDPVEPGRTGSGLLDVVPAAALLDFLIWISFLVQKFVSWRRADGDRREQLKWLAFGASVTVICGIVGSVTNNVLFAGIVALPIGIGVGVLKYRLYEIDRIISRTLAYAIVTGGVVATYVGVITLTSRALGLSSPVAVATSTLAAAALFNPLRHRVQRVVDRRFNRARYNAEVVVSAFAAQLRDSVGFDDVCLELGKVVDGSVEPTVLSIVLLRKSMTGDSPSGVL